LEHELAEPLLLPTLSLPRKSGTLNCAVTRLASAATLTTGELLPFSNDDNWRRRAR
jgi:hypothetical protein